MTHIPGARLLTKGSATKEAVLAAKSPQILHIASHGMFLPDQVLPLPRDGEIPQQLANDGEFDNPLLRSVLALAGFNPGKNQYGGALTALEMSGVDLFETEMVVLSACQTGVGDTRNGEGVYGLRRASVLAGSRTQVMSLWDVADKPTQTLMAEFYRQLFQSIPRVDAMRSSRLMLLRSDNTSHPFYWSAFILSGQWEAI